MLPSKAQLTRRERKKNLKISVLSVTKTQHSHISNMLRPSPLLKSRAKTSVQSFIQVKLRSIWWELRRYLSILPLSWRGCVVRARTSDLAQSVSLEKAAVILFNFVRLFLRLSLLILTASTPS
jgi:hypothetical protein